MTPAQKNILRRAVASHLDQQVRFATGRLRTALLKHRPTLGSEQERGYILTAIAELRLARYAYEAAAPNSRGKELTSAERITLVVAAQILDGYHACFTAKDRHDYSIAILDILDRTFDE